MREYNIFIDGKPYRVQLIKHNEEVPFSLKVNGKSCEVEILNEYSHTAPFSIKVHGKIYKVELGNVDKEAPFPVKVNNVPFRVELKKALRKIVRKIPESPALISIAKPSRKVMEEGVVTAPMGGKIVSMLVETGVSVKVGDVLCILEAMKMENEITAPKAGVVQEVKVSEGIPVNEGEILVVIK